MSMRWLPSLEQVVIGGVAAVLFPLVHVFNDWAFDAFEFSHHISLIYLPAFLRLANVLVLGQAWGTLTTALGGVLLAIWNNNVTWVEGMNVLASATSGWLSVWLFQIIKERPVRLLEMKDLLQLVMLYALMNALLNHVAWTLVEQDALITVHQLPMMVIGDFLGAMLGALLFSWGAKKLKLDQLARKRAQAQDE
jgi:hypothetical protein